jgi:hypothetical protein
MDQPVPSLSWGNSLPSDLLTELMNGGDLLAGLDGFVDEGGLSGQGHLQCPTPVEADWSVLDHERRNSNSTSSSNGECCLEDALPGALRSGRGLGSRKAGLASRSSLPVHEEVFNRAREKNKAAQRAYRQRTKVCFS